MHYFSQQTHVGRFPQDTPLVLTGTAGTAHTGDMVVLQVKIDAHQHIIDAKFKAHGSVATIAACALAAEMLPGLSLSTAHKHINAQILLKKLDLPQIKLHSTLIVEDTINQIISQTQH
jgi:NifU-like protein involved in Fe-S cluster formation